MSSAVHFLVTSVIASVIEWGKEYAHGKLRYPELKEQLERGEEMFVPVYEFEDKYVISNYGVVKSKLLNGKFGKSRKHQTSNRGQKIVILYKDGTEKTKLIHRLVKDSFYVNPNPTYLNTIDHIDNNPGNNYLGNLLFASHKYQNQRENKKPNHKNGAEKLYRKVKMYDLKDKFIMEHLSLVHAEEWLKENGISCPCKSRISACAHGKRDSVHGYKWKYPDIENKDGELWKETPTSVLSSKTHGPYMASTYGRIKNRFGRLIDGTYEDGDDGDGYLLFNGVRVNRIIAFTWIPNDDPINKTEVLHLNDNKRDNSVTNLMWGTHKQNCQDAHDSGANSTSKTIKITDVDTGGENVYNKLINASASMGVSISTISKYARLDIPLEKDGKTYKIEYVN